MKKFFSLVLALVMALSLTTVAWGMTASELQAAIDGVAEGGEYVLSESVDLGSTVLKINKGITLDLGGKTITGEVEIHTTAPVTIKNGSITNDAASGRCVDTRVAVDLTLDGVTLTTTDANTHNQTLTIGNDVDSFSVKVTVKNSTINAGARGYAIINFHPAELKIENSTLTGYTALYMKPASTGSEVTITNSALNGHSYAGNTYAFGTIALEVDDVIIDIDAASSMTSEGTDQAIFRLGTVGKESVSDVEITVADGATLTGDILDVEADDADDSVAADNVAENSVTVPAAYAQKMASEGYVVTVDANGQVAPTAFSASAPAGGTALTTLYDMVTTDATKTKTLSVTVTTYAAKNPTYNADGISVADGNVAYVVFSNLPGKTFVQVNTQGEADYTVYKAGTTTLFGYFDEVVNPFYHGKGVAFYNFGNACTQYKDANFDATASYYTFEDNVYKAVSALDATAGNLMVNNKLVPVSTTSGMFVAHTPAYTYDKDFKVTGVSCSACGAVATIVPNYMSLPEQAIVDGTFGGPINTTMYYYWTNAVVKPVTPTTPSTDKVTSAETFDAGIAMYVGMSVLAATGSAVVIGKKKD